MKFSYMLVSLILIQSQLLQGSERDFTIELDVRVSSASFYVINEIIYVVGVGVCATVPTANAEEQVRRSQVSRSNALAEVAMLLKNQVTIQKKLTSLEIDDMNIENLSLKITEKSQIILRGFKDHSSGTSADETRYYTVIISEISL